MSSNQLQERELCYKLIYQCLEEQAFSNLAMKTDGVTDFVRAAVYGTITYSFFIDSVVKIASKRDIFDFDPETRTLIRFGSWQILLSDKVPDYAAVNTTVSLASKTHPASKSLVNAILRKISDLPSEKRNPENYKPETALSLKPEIYGVLKKSYGKQRALSIGKALLDVPAMTIRVKNNKNIDNELKALGYEASDASFMPCARRLQINNGPSIENSDLFRNGMFFVQSEAAMLASVVANPQKGDKILDCCSAPGGKTTHMAELAEDDCEILALDINESRLELIKQNTARLNLKSIKTTCADSTKLKDCSMLTGKENYFDIVTCDVPCSGLGLMGRKPDIRHTISYDRIQELLPKQREILENASHYVKSGGRLLYYTCTINKQENEECIADFLARHDDFMAEDISSRLPDKLNLNDERLMGAQSGYLTLFPDQDGCDGFFIASMIKK